MAIVSDIEIRLRADIAQLRNDMRRAQGEVSGSVDKIRKSLLTLAAGFGMAEIVNQIIQAQREFDKLNASLITATGSTKAAGEAMKALQSFAAKTPFSLQEVTEGFLKLRNLGLTPSERALESYGNTSAAMGKSLSQLVEAVADAATGEFERLKEFGIKSKQQGDMVAFTFQGTTTKIKNNSADIEEYLTRIGEVNFAGGMKLQADTLDGAISALGDTWRQTLLAFSQSGFGDGVRSGVMQLTDALTDLQAMFIAARSAADDEGDSINKIGPLHAFLSTTFEALTVLGINLAHILKTIGGDIGAIGAAVVAFAKGDFAAARNIIAMRIKDGQAELADVEARSAAILGAAQKARAAREKEAADLKKSGIDRLAQHKILVNGEKSATDEQIKSAQKSAEEARKIADKQAEAYRSLIVTLQDRVTSTARELAGLLPLNEAEKAHLALTAQIAEGKLKLTFAQRMLAESMIDEAGANEVLAKSNKEFEDLQNQIIKNSVELAAERYSLIESAKQEAEQNELAIATYGMTEAAIIRLTASRLMDQEAQRLGRALTEEEIADLQRVIDLKERSAQAVASRAELDAAKTFWSDIEKTARDTFVSIADGGKNAFQRLKDAAKNTFFDWLYQMTLKKWIINIGTTMSGVGGVSGIAQAATSAAGGGIGEAFSLASSAKSIYGALTGGATLAGGLGTGFLGSLAGGLNGAGIGSGLTSAIGLNIGNSIAGVVGSNVASGIATGLSGLAAAAPWVAGALAVYTIGKKAFGRGPKEYTGDQTLNGSLSGGGFSGMMEADWKKKGGWFSSSKYGTDRSPVDAAVSQSLGQAYNAIQTSSADFARVLGANADSIMTRSQTIRIALGKDEAANQKAISDFFVSVADTIAREIIPNIDQFRMEGEAAATTLQRLTTNFAGIDVVLEAMGVTSQQAFGAVGVASIAARERLIAFAGGLDALATQTAYFNDNFISEGERVAIAQRELGSQLAALGYSGLTTADQFRQAVQGLASSGALATEAGARTYAGLLALAPAFKTVTDYIKDINEAARQTLRDQASGALDSLSRSVDAQKDQVSKAFTEMMDSLEMGIDGANDAIERTSDLSRTLRESRIRVDSESQLSASRQSAQSQIASAIAIARSSGVLPSVDDLRDALSTLNQDASGQFASLADYQREVALTNNQLSDLGGLTDEQLGIAERQLKALQDQQVAAEAANDLELMRLDGLVTSAQNQLSAIEGNRTATLSVAEAVYRVDATLRELNYNVNGGTYAAPPVFYAPPVQASTMQNNDEMLTEMRTMNSRMAAAEAGNQAMAQSMQQLASQFDRVSEGGNTLLVAQA